MSQSLTTTDRLEKFIESTPWRRRRVAIALGALLLGVDYLTGPEIIVPTYFILPAMLLAWNWGVRPALALAVVLTVTHIAFLNLWGIPPSGTAGMINAALRSSVLMLLTLMAARLGAQTRAMRERVEVLEGILPTCSFCKDIRNAEDEWERIEAYVERRSAAQFSHGVCPPCAEKHYGFRAHTAASPVSKPSGIR